MYLEKFRLGGQVALVTGGGQAIGLASVEALAEAGAKVVIADRDAGIAETGRDAMKAKGYDVDVSIMDVTNSARVNEVADEVVKKHGKIDILVNNAGIARSETPAETVADEHWLNVIDVNLNGTFWCCRAFGNYMLKAKSGKIVNIGSMSGFIVNKPQEQAFYNASKAAVHHLTKSLAAEWGLRGVRVNAGRADLYQHAAECLREEEPDHVRRLDRRDADGPNGRDRGDRLRRALPRQRCRQPDDRLRRRRRRRLYLLVAPLPAKEKRAGETPALSLNGLPFRDCDALLWQRCPRPSWPRPSPCRSPAASRP